MTAQDASAPSLPEMVGGVIPFLAISPAAQAVDFYKTAFDAQEVYRMTTNDGAKIMHAHLRINGGSVVVNDAFPEFGHPMQTPQGFALHLQVDDVDAWWDRAVSAGCAVAMPLALQFWGDRYGQLTDPYGVQWTMGATPKTTDPR